MKLKEISIIILFLTGVYSYGQQIGDGYAPAVISDFSAPLKSGIYNGLSTSTIGMTNDNSSVWQHLFTARHITATNNYQLQIASSFTVNDRLFFRKIGVGSLVSSNSAWVELATRGSNSFTGNQIVNGNLGIGTLNPTASLEINSSAVAGASETLLKLSVTDAPQDYIRIANGTLSNNQFIPSIEGSRISDNRASLYLTAITEATMDNGSHPLMTFDARSSAGAVVTRPLFSWDSYGNRKMTLTANGSLGIGTATTGSHKLAVEGSIGAREIKVLASGWADFVFKKGYDLPSLEQVEKHIAEKGHLENIPTEEEVLKNGINVGEMNAKLLQKIEELTLYMIEMKKENEKQTEEINNLKSLLNLQKK